MSTRGIARHRLLVSRVLGVLLLAYIFVAAPPAFPDSRIATYGEIVGLILLAAAALGRLWCGVFIAGRKDRVLLTEGPYSVVRNPLYVFSFLGAVGFGLAVENPWLAAVLAVWFVAYYAFTVANEEKVLGALFGSDYAAYCARTPRWVPDIRLFREPESLTVFPGKIRHAIFDAMWFLWAYALWELLEELRALGVAHTWF